VVTGTDWPEATGVMTFPVFAAMVCAAVAAWLMAGRQGGARRARLLLTGCGGQSEEHRPEPPRWLTERFARTRSWVERRGGHAWWCVLGGAVLGLLGASWLPLLGGTVAVPLVRRWLRRREWRRDARRRESAVVELCAAVAGELRVGRPPDRALLTVGALVMREFGSDGRALLAAARFGGDVPAALRKLATGPGAGGLSGVAACWHVSVEGGAGLADGLDQIAGALRAERDQREELEAQLAGPRSTAALLALLPVFGLLLGSAMGASPAHVLLHSAPGLACLIVGGLLEWAGLFWVARLVRTAQGPAEAGRREAG
jgi:tight adherence protein B